MHRRLRPDEEIKMLEWDEDDKPMQPEQPPTLSIPGALLPNTRRLPRELLTAQVNQIEAEPDPEVVTPPTGSTDKLEIVSGGRVKESPGLVVFRFNREPTLPELRDMFYAVNDKLA